MRVLVTGAGGYFGRTILPTLLADPRIARVVATDRVPVAVDPRATFVQADLARDDLTPLFADVDAAIHLAFHVERRPGQDVSALNVGAAAAFLAAAAARLDVVVFASSVMAYGFGHGPDQRLVESDAGGPGRGFYYAEHKIAAERAIAALAPTAKARLVTARPTVVGGPGIPAQRAAPYRGPVLVVPRTPFPLRYQMLHEADLGPAFATLLHAPTGVYNVAPGDDITLPEVGALLGQYVVTLPRALCAVGLTMSWALGAGAIGPDWLATLDSPLHVVDNAKLRGLGWQPGHSTRDALLAVRG